MERRVKMTKVMMKRKKKGNLEKGISKEGTTDAFI